MLVLKPFWGNKNALFFCFSKPSWCCLKGLQKSTHVMLPAAHYSFLRSLTVLIHIAACAIMRLEGQQCTGDATSQSCSSYSSPHPWVPSAEHPVPSKSGLCCNSAQPFQGSHTLWPGPVVLQRLEDILGAFVICRPSSQAREQHSWPWVCAQGPGFDVPLKHQYGHGQPYCS